MMHRDQLLATLYGWLEPQRFRDYCPNGLQVEGQPEISRIVCGVTASEALIDRAIQLGAQAILVHHGYFWRGEAPELVGRKAARLRKLLRHDINLLAYHLPLDVHPQLGNNAQLGAVLGLTVTGQITAGDVPGLLWHGELPSAMTPGDLAQYVGSRLQRQPLLVAGNEDRYLRTIAWCTGGAQGYLDQAKALGVDVYLSGEVSEQTYHAALEEDIVYLGAGHHATERYGVKALAARLSNEFEVETLYIELENPV